MKFYTRDNDDKLNNINRCFFDAEHGWASLALERLADLLLEFPNDPQVEYAEGLIRRDSLGQGIRAQECFLRAQSHAVSCSRSNRNYLFSTFNATKHARNLTEYRTQEKIARDLAPDDPDLVLFDQLNKSLAQGAEYAEILAQASNDFREHGRHGECAAFCELALQAKDWNIDDEISLRNQRANALRELDKAADASRKVRGETFPPEERLTLVEALEELERSLVLDPGDHMAWNFKSGWLNLMNRPLEAIAAADRSLSLGVEGYVKPFINKALACATLKRPDEARTFAEEARRKAAALGIEGRNDLDLATNFLRSLDAPKNSDDDLLHSLAEHILNSSALVSKDECAHEPGASPGDGLVKSLRTRSAKIGRAWDMEYVTLMAQMLVYFCPQTAWRRVLQFSETNETAYEHCIHAVIYLAAHGERSLRRDACRFLIILFLGATEPQRIRRSYREAIIATSAVGPGEFTRLAQHMRDELSLFNPTLVPLLCDQSPLSAAELERARHITLARFIDGISRDPVAPRPPSLMSRFLGFLKSHLPTFNMEPRIGEGCSLCHRTFPTKGSFLVSRSAMHHVKQGLRCRQCGRLTCDPCCNYESTCKCGARAWSAFSYVDEPQR